MTSPFHAYDIRGIVDKEITDDLVQKITRASITFLKPKTIVIGMDQRESSLKYKKIIINTLKKYGITIIDIGLCSTCMLYFAGSFYKTDAAFMITASHNPKEYNGIKICKKNGVAISKNTGLKKIEQLVQTEKFKAYTEKKGTVKQTDIFLEYKKAVLKYNNLKSRPKVIIDTANSVGFFEAQILKDVLDIQIINENIEHGFPNHEANPAKPETLKQLQKEVKKRKALFGVGYDGDADRCGFVDEKGNIISMSNAAIILIKFLLPNKKIKTVAHDLTVSKAVKEQIKKLKGKSFITPVGNPFVKEEMIKQKSSFGFENSGHFFLQENKKREMSALTTLYMAMALEKTKPSAYIKKLNTYTQLSQINIKVNNKDKAIEKVKQAFKKQKKSFIDGISIDCKNYWFNIRASNTEPLLRITLEAKTNKIAQKAKKDLLLLLRK